MPEYFDISLIVKKTETSKELIAKCLFENFGLSKGENEAVLFERKGILVSHFENEKADFDEICIGFPKQTFHKETFEKELGVFTSFINKCFECSIDLKFAVCSYELNGYLLDDVKEIKEFSDDLLNKFPIIYKRKGNEMNPVSVINLNAQEILL